MQGVTKNSAGPTPTSNSSISTSTSVPAFSTGKATASIKVDKPVQGSRQGGERVGFEVPNEHVSNARYNPQHTEDLRILFVLHRTKSPPPPSKPPPPRPSAPATQRTARLAPTSARSPTITTSLTTMPVGLEKPLIPRMVLVSASPPYSIENRDQATPPSQKRAQAFLKSLLRRVKVLPPPDPSVPRVISQSALVDHPTAHLLQSALRSSRKSMQRRRRI